MRKYFHYTVRILCFAMLYISFSSFQALATDTTDTYQGGISVGLVTLGNTTSLDFKLTGNYFVKDQNFLLKPGIPYKVTLANSWVKLSDAKTTYLQSYNELTLIPENDSAELTFIKDTEGRRFPGTIDFKSTDGKLLPINKLPIETYVKALLPLQTQGVLTKEKLQALSQSSSSPTNDYVIDLRACTELLKAQAVISRTYAVKSSGDPGDAAYSAADNDEFYPYKGLQNAAAVKGSSNSDYMWDNYRQATPGTDVDLYDYAAASTKGLILSYNNTPINALYTLSNGGYTDESTTVFDVSYPYYKYMQDPFDVYNREWTLKKTPKDISDLVNKTLISTAYGTFYSIDYTHADNYNSSPLSRMRSLPLLIKNKLGAITTFTVNKDNIRKLFNLNSTLCSISYEDGYYVFRGNGYGSGIGLSQWGAYYRGKNGKSFTDILGFYYPGAVYDNLYTASSVLHYEDSQNRFGGQDRFETSTMISAQVVYQLSMKHKISNEMLDNVILASGRNYPDALAGAVLAKKLNAPILLVDTSPQRSVQALNYIRYNLKSAGNIYILGGTGAVSNDFITTLTEDYGYARDHIVRLGGRDRKETSFFISTNVPVYKTSPIVLVNGSSFGDSLTVSPIAAAHGWPMFLVDRDSLDVNLINYLKNNNPDKIYLMGNTDSISDNLANQIKTLLKCGDDKLPRFGGKTIYETSRIINSAFMQNPSEVIIASGTTFPDALSGSIYAAVQNAPILIVPKQAPFKDAEDYIRFIGRNSTPVQLSVLGLENAVSEATVQQLLRISR